VEHLLALLSLAATRVSCGLQCISLSAPSSVLTCSVLRMLPFPSLPFPSDLPGSPTTFHREMFPSTNPPTHPSPASSVLNMCSRYYLPLSTRAVNMHHILLQILGYRKESIPVILNGACMIVTFLVFRVANNAYPRVSFFLLISYLGLICSSSGV
jgi:hypothetical protein